MQDLHNHVDPVQDIKAQGIGGGVTGNGADLQNYDQVDIHLNLQAGSNDGSYSISVEESDDNASWSAVDSSDLQGSFSSDLDDGNDKMESVGYVGGKRYVRTNITEGSASTTKPTAAVTVVRGRPRKAPQ